MTGEGTLAGLFSRDVFPVSMASPTGSEERGRPKSRGVRACRIAPCWQMATLDYVPLALRQVSGAAISPIPSGALGASSGAEPRCKNGRRE